MSCPQAEACLKSEPIPRDQATLEAGLKSELFARQLWWIYATGASVSSVPAEHMSRTPLRSWGRSSIDSGHVHMEAGLGSRLTLCPQQIQVHDCGRSRCLTSADLS